MRNRKLKVLILCIAILITIIGVGILIYTFMTEQTETGNLTAGILSAIIGLIGILYSVIASKSDKPLLLDFETATKLADEKLIEAISLSEKIIAELNEKLAQKNLPTWEQTAKYYLQNGELQNAIASIDTDVSDEEAAQKHIFKAHLYIINYQFTEAEQHLKQATIIFSSFDNNFAMASFYNTLNRLQEAIDYFERCLILTPSSEKQADVFNNLGYAQWKNNDYPQAKTSYIKALKIHRRLAKENPKVYLPSLAGTLNNLAVFYRSNNEYPKALNEYEEALKIFRRLAKKNPNTYLPNVAGIMNNLATLHLNINEYPKALKEYEEALKIYRKLAKENPRAYLPNLAMTLHNLATFHSNVNAYSKALEKFEEALIIYRKLASENPQVYLLNVAMTLNNLATSHSDVNEYQKALKELEEALIIYRGLAKENPKVYLPYLASTLNNLAKFYQDCDLKIDLSLKYVNEAIEVLGKCNKTPYVGELLNIAIGLKSDGAVIYHNIGERERQKGNNDNAIECYEKAIEIKPDFEAAYIHMGFAYANKKNYDKAIECFEKAIEIEPDDANTMVLLGTMYQAKDNYDKAIEYYDKAIDLKPINFALVYYFLGTTYLQKSISDPKYHTNAVENFQKAAKLGNEEAQQWLEDNNIS